MNKKTLEELNKERKANGEDIEISVLDTFKLDGYNDKQYIAYTLDEIKDDMVKVYIGILNESDEEFSIDEIKDEKEFEIANKAYKDLLAGSEEA